jgi:hypothetical protein
VRASQVECDPRPHKHVEHAVRAAHPPDAHPSPEALAGAAQGHRLGRERSERAGHRPAVEGERLVRLVHDGDRPGSPQEHRELLSPSPRHQVAGRVLEVGDQVGQGGPRRPQHATERVEIPAVDVHGSADETSPGAAQSRERVGVSGRLDQHAVARPHQGLSHDGESGERPGHHHDLRGVGRQPARVVRRGDGLLEHGDAGGEVAVAAEIARQVLECLGVRRPDARHGGRRRGVEVDDVVAGGRRREGPVQSAAAPARQPGVGAGALLGLGETALDEPGVRAGHGGPGQPQRSA